MNADVTIFFVIQPGNLSLKARFLVSSLRYFGPEKLRIRACLPLGDDEIDNNTSKLLDYFSVERKYFQPELWEKHKYPIGNKIDAACLEFDTAYALFLDTDMIALRPFSLNAFCRNDLRARPIMGQHCFTAENADVFQQFVKETLGGQYLQLTDAQSRLKVPSRVGPPIYNSGMVAYAADKGIAERWKELLLAVMTSQTLPMRMKYPFADQTSLACLALEVGDRFSVADKRWNLSIKSELAGGIILHYFKFSKLLSKSRHRKLVGMLHDRYTKAGLNLLGELSRKELYGFGREVKISQTAKACSTKE